MRRFNNASKLFSSLVLHKAKVKPQKLIPTFSAKSVRNYSAKEDVGMDIMDMAEKPKVEGKPQRQPDTSVEFMKQDNPTALPSNEQEQVFFSEGNSFIIPPLEEIFQAYLQEGYVSPEVGEVLSGNLDLTSLMKIEQWARSNEDYIFSYIDRVEDPEERYERAVEEKKAKEKLINTWRRQGKSREELFELIKKGEGDKIIDRMFKWETSHWARLFTGNRTQRIASYFRVNVFSQYAMILPILNYSGLNKLAYDWSVRVVEIGKRYEDYVDRWSLVLAEYNRILALWAMGHSDSTLIQETFACFKTIEDFLVYARHAVSAQGESPDYDIFYQEYIDMRRRVMKFYGEWALGQYNGKNAQQVFALLDKWLEYQPGEFKNLARPIHLAYKCQINLLEGNLEQADHYWREAVTLQMSYLVFANTREVSAGNMTFIEHFGPYFATILKKHKYEPQLLAHYVGVIENFVDIDDEAEDVLGLPTTDKRDEYGPSAFAALRALLQHDSIQEAEQVIDTGLAYYHNNQIYYPEMVHLLVDKAYTLSLGSKEAIQESETDVIIQNCYKSAYALSKLQRGPKNPDILTVLIHYERYCSKMGLEEKRAILAAEVADLRKRLNMWTGRTHMFASLMIEKTPVRLPQPTETDMLSLRRYEGGLSQERDNLWEDLKVEQLMRKKRQYFL